MESALGVFGVLILGLIILAYLNDMRDEHNSNAVKNRKPYLIPTDSEDWMVPRNVSTHTH